MKQHNANKHLTSLPPPDNTLKHPKPNPAQKRFRWQNETKSANLVLLHLPAAYTLTHALLQKQPAFLSFSRRGGPEFNVGRQGVAVRRPSFLPARTSLFLSQDFAMAANCVFAVQN